MKFCDKVNIDDYFDENEGGLYAWTFDDWENTPRNTKYKIKIGMSTNTCARIYSYHTAHPYGVWILALMKLKTTDKKEISSLEKQLKNELKQYFYQAPSRAPNKGEWYECQEIVVRNAFKKVYEKNKSKCKEPVRLKKNRSK